MCGRSRGTSRAKMVGDWSDSHASYTEAQPFTNVGVNPQLVPTHDKPCSQES